MQGAVEEALERFLGELVRVKASGRTDAGVHATGQVIAFDAFAVRTERAMRDGLNAHLPRTVACVDARVVPAEFDARGDVVRKRYRYTWLDRPSRSPMREDRGWHLRRRLDDRAMAEAARLLEGQHDFSAFRAEGCTAKHPTRTVEVARVIRVEDEVQLEMVGNGFLRHMIRIVAGTLTEVGVGRRPPAWVGEVLEGRDRARAARTAPASGLCLERVWYRGDPDA